MAIPLFLLLQKLKIIRMEKSIEFGFVPASMCVRTNVSALDMVTAKILSTAHEDTMTTSALPLTRIESRILLIRGQKVMVDADLAELYGVPTKRLNEQVKRNRDRFPADFMFNLTPQERDEVVANCDHLAKLKFSKSLPFAFTEHGAIQAANVLASPQAIAMGVYVVRAFIHLRELVTSNNELALRLNELDSKTELLSLKQGTFEHDARAQLKQIIATLRALTAPPEASPKRPIGFVLPNDAPAKTKAGKIRR